MYAISRQSILLITANPSAVACRSILRALITIEQRGREERDVKGKGFAPGSVKWKHNSDRTNRATDVTRKRLTHIFHIAQRFLALNSSVPSRSTRIRIYTDPLAHEEEHVAGETSPENALIIYECGRVRKNISIYLKSHPFESNYRDEIKMSTNLDPTTYIHVYAPQTWRVCVACDRSRAVYLQI